MTDVVKPGTGHGSGPSVRDKTGAVAGPGPFSVLGIRDYRFLVLSNMAAFAGYQIRNMGQA